MSHWVGALWTTLLTAFCLEQVESRRQRVSFEHGPIRLQLPLARQFFVSSDRF
jgi:hypothetical protein